MSDGFDFIDGLEHDLVAAAARRRDATRAARVARLRQRFGLRGGGLALLLFAFVGVATAGATFAVLRAAVIQAPAARDVPREQTPAAGSGQISPLRAADPVAGRPPWTLRLSRSSTGLLCTTTGQLVDGRFGLIGLDGRFRTYDERIADSCGERVAGPHASLLGARIFSARVPGEVRTVVNGVGGSELRSVTLVTDGGRRTLPLGPGGTFVAALRGYPEDNALRVELAFADGSVERHDLGVGRAIVPDPAGGGAWRVDVSAQAYSADRDRCVVFRQARPARQYNPYLPSAPTSPAACGRTRRGMPASGAYYAVRRVEPGSVDRRERMRGGGNWGDHPPRTAVWGGFAEDVARIEVLGPGGLRRRASLTPRHVFLVILAPSVDPASLTVRVTLMDGSVREGRGDYGLIEGRWAR
ncbi:hypothetical protein Q5424_11375 [Conexibacter sp. JD483]|uniref:hypothetical protein n=1 Tax=unclassified Conexibacter TaxID=2627773 RepID=UPI0027184F6E|nr:MULTISPECIES: hypothetical protein [unclassified Conexibacter]MDO8187903.1 hypothetical protein [Conexibacter sp. CPCC 205706]MDO8198646.1 hypothetical protein [Conexibacter sp. CPCC 205762]MDR9369686.1 hypothetical protein [Conexibacter sp. JD483]